MLDKKDLNDLFFLNCLELVQSSSKPDLSTIINQIFNENWSYLPAGGGLHSK